MIRRNNPNLTKLFKGFRIGKQVIPKLNLKFLEKQTKLTDLQHQIVEEHRKKCTPFNSSKEHRARLDSLLERPVVKAASDYLGNLVVEKKKKREAKKKLEEPKEETKE